MVYDHFHAGWDVAGNTSLPVDQAGRLTLRRHAQRYGDLQAKAVCTFSRQSGGLP
jgi:hypothetical protein